MPRNYKDFARPTFRESRWLETQWFSAWSETGMRLHLWIGFRTNLEIVTTKVFAVSKVAESILDMDYCDQQYHVPMGDARLGDFKLSNGISLKGHPAPKEWTVKFQSPCGRFRADLEVTSLMDPVGLDWTKIEGSGPGFVGFHQTSDPGLPQDRAGIEPVGHIDQTVAVVGEMEVDGETSPVDCVAQHDHSWSPRAEYRHSPGNYDTIHFGRDLSLVGHVRELPDGSPDVTHAYVLREGEARQIREISVEYRREGFRTRAFEYKLTDQSGEAYTISGERRSGFEIDMGPNIYISFDQFDCQWDGHEGLAETQWHNEIMRMQGERRAASRAEG